MKIEQLFIKKMAQKHYNKPVNLHANVVIGLVDRMVKEMSRDMGKLQIEILASSYLELKEELLQDPYQVLFTDIITKNGEYLDLEGFTFVSGRYKREDGAIAQVSTIRPYSGQFAYILKRELGYMDIELLYDGSIDGFFADTEELRIEYIQPHSGTKNNHFIRVCNWLGDYIYEAEIPNYSYVEQFIWDLKTIIKHIKHINEDFLYDTGFIKEMMPDYHLEDFLV